jgi:micrococcal nuclease
VILRPHIAAAAALAFFALGGCATSNDQPPSPAAAPLAKADFPGQFVPVLYAVDGDTLRVRLLEGRLAYVRLVGVDTPEDVRPGSPIECGSKQAAASMQQLAPDGATVLLRPDSVADPRDRYGRILAHAFVKGRQLELAQLRRGWAYVYRYDNQRFDGLPAFEVAERHARQAHLGVWGLCHGDFHSAEPGDQN